MILMLMVHFRVTVDVRISTFYGFTTLSPTSNGDLREGVHHPLEKSVLSRTLSASQGDTVEGQELDCLDKHLHPRKGEN